MAQSVELQSIIGLTDPQRLIFACPKRFRVAVAGRRFGKTYLARHEAIHEAQQGHDKLVWYVAPTYKMAKDIFWQDLKQAIPPEAIKKKDEGELYITLHGCNSTIALKGADNPDSLRGKGLDHVIMDEAADQKHETWTSVLYPALTDKGGSALFIGTPKGYNWFYDLTIDAENDPLWQAFHFTTEQGGNVSKQELDYARRTMSARHFEQEFLASFKTLAGRVYSSFDRKGNVDAGVEYLGGDILIGMDFNVDPMSAVLCSRAGNQLHQFDEIAIPNGNTTEMCYEIRQRYPSARIIVYPDPSGRARKTSAPVGTTDFSIIRGFGFGLLSKSRAPFVVNRVNEVNAMMCNVHGVRRYFVHPRCKHTIKGLDGLTYKKGTSIPDKSLGIDHHPDGLGYLIDFEFPIAPKMLTTKIIGL